MATHAIILTRIPSAADARLARVLEHFGVSLEVISFGDSTVSRSEDDHCVLFAALDTFAAVLERHSLQLLGNVKAVYLYPTQDRDASERALRQLEGWTAASLVPAGVASRKIIVSSALGELDGPMAGIAVNARLQSDDFVLSSSGCGISISTLVDIDGLPAFVRFEYVGVPIFLTTSAAMIDIEQPVSGPFFDVKHHFCSLVPLMMFVTWAFRDTMWRPFETGACLIIDDPLLKPTYGFCNFDHLLRLMNQHEFTTNVAFIPWNWRRTTLSSGEIFRRESRRLSVSVHGCDHTASEFGETSPDVLDGKARLAQLRMRKHETRTGIAHEPIMVFPQGVFSSQTPGVLKRNGFIAAVNTELNPVDPSANRTLIRDVLDVAIRRYGTFPIYTRRYAAHGLENFAFDALIGKPCLIVSHHGSFKNGCAEVIDLVRGLNGLRTRLTWRSLGGVVRRAARQRTQGAGSAEIEMYASELVVRNPSKRPMDVVVRKKEEDPDFVAGVRRESSHLEWRPSGDSIVFEDTIPAEREARYTVSYTPSPVRSQPSRPIRFAASVAARRLLCEFRDEYWQKYVRR